MRNDIVLEERLGEKNEIARVDWFVSVGCISFGFGKPLYYIYDKLGKSNLLSKSYFKTTINLQPRTLSEKASGPKLWNQMIWHAKSKSDFPYVWYAYHHTLTPELQNRRDPCICLDCLDKGFVNVMVNFNMWVDLIWLLFQVAFLYILVKNTATLG